jgi:hypothetical protein
MFQTITPTPAEISLQLPGDEIIPAPDVVMDRAFTLPATPEEVWPWFVQLGKNRAGWYFPNWVERFLLPRRRGLRDIDKSLQDLSVGRIIDDWGGRDGYFEVAQLQPPTILVHKSTRGKLSMSWAIVLRADEISTRVLVRLRMAPVRRKFLARMVGGLVDALTILGLAAGLRERLENR